MPAANVNNIQYYATASKQRSISENPAAKMPFMKLVIKQPPYVLKGENKFIKVDKVNKEENK